MNQTQAHRLFNRRGLLALLSLLLAVGFFSTTLSSYFVSRHTIREHIIEHELPLTASSIYAEIQKDLGRPVLVSSTMAHNTFLRDWVLHGERDVAEIAHYLGEVKTRFGAFSSFFVSENSATYYTGEGILKKVLQNDPRDAWYYRVRDMKEPYELNVDPDMANKDAMTIFINYRVLDINGKYLGATGVGLTMDAAHRRIRDYQQRHQRTIYLVNEKGQAVLQGVQSQPTPHAVDLHSRPGLSDLMDRILREKNGSYQYMADGVNYLLNVQYVPELKWYLFVEKDESEPLGKIHQILYINLAVCLAITLLVVALMHKSFSRYQGRIEEMASTDKLTGLLSRQAFSILIDKLLSEYKRTPRPISMLMVDVDHFKRINDQHGHAVGDQVLAWLTQRIRNELRQSDIAVRWGGEEFLVVLNECELAEASKIAEKLRLGIELEHFEVTDQRLPITISVGVSEYNGKEPVEQTIGRADAGLYVAKNGGRNRVGVTEAAA